MGVLGQKQVFLCKHCGLEFSDIRTLTSNICSNHPSGAGRRHELYEGGVKTQYVCKHCGMTYRALRDLTRNRCTKDPSGKGRHEAAL